MLIYRRYNPFDKLPEDNVTAGDALRWIESPDGTRALAVNPGHYVGALRYLMQVKSPVDDAAFRRNVQGAPAQILEDGKTTLVSLRLPSLGVKSVALRRGSARPAREAELPKTTEMNYYSASVNPSTGALVSLELKPSGREVLGGPANVVLAQLVDLSLKPEGKGPIWQAHFMPKRAECETEMSSSDSRPSMQVCIGPTWETPLNNTMMGQTGAH